MNEMQKNSTHPSDFDFSKLKKIEPDSIESKLYNIIDDIDSASDAFKPPKSPYANYIYKKVREAQKLIISDGYNLYYAPTEAQNANR